MSDSREEEERRPASVELEPNLPAPSSAWDPLASVRKTISPTQRMKLLKMTVPVLPPEDFLDTGELQRGRPEQSRRFLPLVFALLGGFLVLFLAGLWSRFESTAASSDKHASPVAVPASSRAALEVVTSAAPPNPSPRSLPEPPLPAATSSAASELSAARPPGAKSLPRASSAPAPAAAKAKPPSTAEPAPRGITFWTQPR